MATRRQGPQRYGNLSELTLNQEYELLHGHPLISFFGFQDDEEMEIAWKIHQQELRDAWQSNHPPGTRCFAEWLFEIIPQFGERLLTDAGKAILPHRKNWETHGILHTRLIPPAQESEAEFLHRHGLINAWEFSQAEEIERAEKEHLQRWFDWIHKKQAAGTSPAL